MESFDPLFDEDPLVVPIVPPVRFSLPTNEVPHPFVAPSSISDERDVELFDKNVGTIALPGSQSSEHPSALSLASSVDDLDSAQTIVPSKGRRKTSKSSKEQPKKRSMRRQTQQQYPSSSATQSDVILAQLAKDPNVVPLLQAVVEYVYRTELRPSQPQPASPPQSVEQPSERPTKRRRLNRVPAGAEDWAIPFPFQQGEGPQNYKETWEMKRLMLLLSSLMRNLRDWRRSGGTISVNPLPPQRPYRSRSKPLPTQELQDGLDLLLPQFDIPNPSGLDLSLETLLEVFNSYEKSNESALNVDLGALSSGDSISQILFTTSAASEQTVPWDDYSNLFGMSQDNQTDSSFIFTPEPSQEAQDVDMVDAEQLLNGMANSTLDLSLWSDLFDQGVGGESFIANSGDNPPMDFMSDAPHNKFAPLDVTDTTHQADSIVVDQELQNILDLALSASVNDIPLPSMSASPSMSISATMDTATPTFNTLQMLDLTPCSTPSLHPISTLSKRGKGRSTQALRRDLNKQLRLNSVETPLSTSLASSPKDATAKGKKVRISEATLKERERTLEQAKEWREVMAKELEKARLTRWESMMEGFVLQEVGVLLRNGPQ